MDSYPRFERSTLHVLTFLVAFCSFAYELVYAELLTIVYGGTVTQYGLTVGLFFSSLGVGSFLVRTLDHERPSNFFRTELLLAISAPLGFVAILWIGSADVPNGVPPWTFEWLARLPVIVVGGLSGFELPLLTAMVERLETDPSERLLALRERLRAATYRVVGLVFHVSTDSNDQDSYSTVLGMDYLGGLGGSLVYVFVLYPDIGLFATIFVLGLLNAVAALAFVLRFSDRSWGLLAGGSSIGSRERTALVVACLLVASVYGGLALQHEAVDSELSAFYLERSIEQEFPSDAIEVEVDSVRTTNYQRVSFYNRTWTDDRPNTLFDGESERCFRLGTAVQLCDSWAEPYHEGLVDVPMSRFENGSETNVLVVGGGDWIAVDHLREYGVSVDLVDLDGEFLHMTRDDPWFERYHHDAYEYDRLNVTVADAHQYLRETDEQYDLILLDLPGATDDDLLGLYSTQFYEQLRTHLRPDGVVGTWTYQPSSFPRHAAAYTNTVHAAGFEQSLSYWAWDDLDGDGRDERVERFVLLSPQRDPGPALANTTASVSEYHDYYASQEWYPIVEYRGVEPNGIFDPNYGILIDT